ncbi:MAG: putative DNA binding domain-containing protein [Oscillospiraceae bacterium]|jgi:ATP-dependent DNA helicase RecG|nr:putative DNA binding domain-containing protein [Oscillospiraceae bacterium]
MAFKESETVELKQIIVDEIKKEIVAFANSGGGTLYVGVADNGEVIGLSDADADLTNINNMLRDGIKPDVTMFTQSRIEDIDGKRIVAVSVQSGTDRPYYLAGKGIRPEGVFVRHGASSVPATDTAIRKMIRETDGESYEKLRSIEQELVFSSANAEFTKRGVDSGAAQMATLGLFNADRIYTNLALLLSEQCVHTIKTAVFQDTTQQIFIDRREFGGSLFKQINEVYDYLDLNNKTSATFDKLLRVDKRDYPETALREALLNAVVHREYATSGSILIKMFTDRVEFISPGGLVSGIEIDDIMSGYSACRNTQLAAVFYRLQLIEAYGTGILKIYESYKTTPRQPKIEVTPNVFKMILPNVNYAAAERPQTAQTPEQRISEYMRENGSISRKQAQELLGVSQTTAGVVLRKLTESGDLRRDGGSRNLRYFAARGWR